MKILGAKEILNIVEPKLVYEFWTDTNKCRELLKDMSLEKVLSIIKNNVGDYHTLENVNFHVWVGDNSAQVYPLIKPEYNADEYDNEEDYDSLELTDINIVGDASPRETLWFVFEKSEWEYLDKYLGLELSKILKDIWSECEEYSKEKHNNTWAKEELRKFDNDYKHKNDWDRKWYLESTDIVNANIEIKLL